MEKLTLWVEDPTRVAPIIRLLRQNRLRLEYIFILLPYESPREGSTRLMNQLNTLEEGLHLGQGLYGVRLPDCHILLGTGGALNSEDIINGIEKWLTQQLRQTPEQAATTRALIESGQILLYAFGQTEHLVPAARAIQSTWAHQDYQIEPWPEQLVVPVESAPNAI